MNICWLQFLHGPVHEQDRILAAEPVLVIWHPLNRSGDGWVRSVTFQQALWRPSGLYKKFSPTTTCRKLAPSPCPVLHDLVHSHARCMAGQPLESNSTWGFPSCEHRRRYILPRSQRIRKADEAHRSQKLTHCLDLNYYSHARNWITVNASWMEVTHCTSRLTAVIYSKERTRKAYPVWPRFHCCPGPASVRSGLAPTARDKRDKFAGPRNDRGWRFASWERPRSVENMHRGTFSEWCELHRIQSRSWLRPFAHLTYSTRT